MLVTEEELSIQITEVDGIQIDNVDLAEAGEDKVLQKLTANSPGADHEDAGLMIAILAGRWKLMAKRTNLLDSGM